MKFIITILSYLAFGFTIRMKEMVQRNTVMQSNRHEKKKNKPWLWITAVGLLSYGLSVFNDYALDDFIVIVKNKFTQQGLAGIRDILSNDTFAGMTDAEVSGLVGARYRPLSLVTFAIEEQIFNGNPFISHLLNVLLFLWMGLLLHKWLQLFNTPYPENTWHRIALVSTLLFLSLPVHSESIINIKGRDDLLCLVFFLLASIRLLIYSRTGKTKNLLWASLLYFFSLMSKETAVTFLAVFPIMLYLFSEATKKKILQSVFFFGVLAAIFLVFRFLATMSNTGTLSEDILNNPFLHATTTQRYATVLLTSLHYFKLIVFPFHLSYDYNFNAIPVTDFSNPWVLLSVIFHATLAISVFYFFRRKPVYSFSIFFYFVTWSIVSNFFFNTGTPLAERFVLIPSIGFCLAITTLVTDVVERNRSGILVKAQSVILVIVISTFTIRNVIRCSDWKDNNTLFLADADETPNSAKVQLNAGIACLNYARENLGGEKEKWLKESMVFLKRGIAIYPDKPDGYINIGVAYSWMEDYKNAEKWWNLARVINPLNPQLKEPDRALAGHYLKAGLNSGASQNYDSAIFLFRHGLTYDSLHAELLYNLGGAYYTVRNRDSAMYFFQKALFADPEHPNAASGLRAAMQLDSSYNSRRIN